MENHRLLNRQIKKFLGADYIIDEKLSEFLKAINRSYISFERDKELTEHAFSVSESEYVNVQDELKNEIDIRNESLEMLKKTVRTLSPDINFGDEKSSDSLLRISEILEYQINETNKARAELQLFKNIIDSSSDAIQVAYESGRLFYVNRLASERIGIPMDRVKEYTVRDFEQIFQIHPEAWLNHLHDVKTNNQLMLEGTNINRDSGLEFPVEVTAKYIKNGDKGMIIAISRDISERKEHEKLLRLQEEKYRNIISNMNLGLLEVDNNDKILFCNQSFEYLSGYTIDEIKGKEAKELFMDENEKTIIEAKNVKRQTGKSDSYEIKVKDKKRQEKWWLISGAPNYNDNGDIIGSIGIHLDITEQKHLELELEIAYKKSKEASEAKEAFLANMSHEIRTPLNAIIGMIRELSREKLSIKQQGFLRHTDSAANHLLSIVNSILDMSKIEAGEFQLDEHNFSLPALIGNIESILKNKAQRKQLSFQTHIDTRVLPAHIGDGPRLRQIFINLLDNSIKFTERGSINLYAKVQFENKYLQKIRFTIMDTGIGMDEGYLKQIFTKFSQEEKSTSRRFGGTGLGMPITKELIQIMGGDIHVESQKGIGTTIYIDLTLPIGKIEELKPERRAAEKNGLSGTKVLLVEDNEMNRFIALQSLQFLGCKVEEAENGLVALEKVKSNRYDVILMDIQMPEMDGVTTTQNIRGQLQLDTPIIAVTANAFKEDIDLYLNIGMNDFVTKPFEEFKLYEAIAKVVGMDILAKTHIENADNISHVSMLYDLTKLRELSRGNEAFVTKMVDIFKESTPPVISEMNSSFLAADYVNISKIAHKLKPSIENLGIYRLEGKAKELEDICKNESPNNMEIKQKLDFFITELQTVLEQM